MNAIIFSLALLCAAGDPVETSPAPETMLYIRTTPSGAEILLDGKPLGTSDGLFPVQPGKYKIVLDLEGHQPHEQTITVRDGRITRIVLRLAPHPEAPDNSTASTARLARKVHLPDADARGAKTVLDLASGEVFGFREADGPGPTDGLMFTRMGKGDLFFDSLLGCLRGAKAMQWDGRRFVALAAKEQIKDATAYELPSVPCRLLITTAEKKNFDVTILARTKHDGGIDLEYRPADGPDSPKESEERSSPIAESPAEELGADGLIDSPTLLAEFKRLFREMIAEQKEAGDLIPADWDLIPADFDRPEFLSTMAEEFKKEDPLVFSVTPQMEKLFTQEKFDRESLSKQIARTIKVLSDFGVSLPALSRSLVERFQSGDELSGAQLEVTVRVLGSHVAGLRQKVNEPDGDAVAPARPERLTIDIDSKGALSIDGKPFDEQSLAAALRIAATGNASPTVVLRCDRELPHQRVVEVIGVLKASGVKKIALSAAVTPHTAKLDFRIAPTEETLTPEEIKQHISQLSERGPFAGRERTGFGWFAVKEELQAPLITSEYQGQGYVLLSNRPDDVMLSGDDQHPWGIKETVVQDASSDRPSILFRFDEAGARRMSRFSKAHLQRRLAALIDDRVMFCPTIRSTLSESIMVTGGFTLAEAKRLVDSLQSGVVKPAEESPPLPAEGPPSDLSAILSTAKVLANALELYRLDKGDYPTTLQGLEALIVRPNDESNPDHWKGPYLKSKSLLLNPWQRPYQYEYEGEYEGPKIWSLVPDGRDGTADDF